jgi:uncharacterized protein
MKTALIIFVKNLRYGQVKTRLAEKLGHEQAFEIYKMLLQHTRRITSGVKTDKFLFYSDKIENDDWPVIFSRQAQQGDDLGKRMQNAFELLFSKGYQKLVIIGSDCLELNSTIIEQGFYELDEMDVVIGPAKDGGYYLMGLKKNSPFLFENIEWSTNKVLEQTVTLCSDHKLRYSLLEVLNDIDEPEDWLNAKQTVNEEPKNHLRL